tara:strand:+ start:8530 stop:8829 length:300 start_codon:yes stop_codon:yes gene_type:complete
MTIHAAIACSFKTKLSVSIVTYRYLNHTHNFFAIDVLSPVRIQRNTINDVVIFFSQDPLSATSKLNDLPISCRQASANIPDLYAGWVVAWTITATLIER